MPKIYLINVGANSAHHKFARCPIFPDGSFVYVPFPYPYGEFGTRPYPTEAWPFTNGLTWYQTHADPDWENLTYGDYVANARAAALRAAQPNDILLFWSLLWENTGRDWNHFTGKQHWCLIGAIRIEELLIEGQSAEDAKRANRKRAEVNAHFVDYWLEPGHIVFIGDKKHSFLFPNAVPLVGNSLKTSLLYKSFRTKDGSRLPLNGKHWSGYARSCRAIWDLEDPKQRKLANIVRDAVEQRTGHNILAGL